MADLVVGVDLGGTKVLAGVVGPDTRVLSRVKRKTATFKDQPAALLDLVGEAVGAAVEQAGQPREAVAAVGLGVTGSLELERSVVVGATPMGGTTIAAR